MTFKEFKLQLILLGFIKYKRDELSKEFCYIYGDIRIVDYCGNDIYIYSREFPIQINPINHKPNYQKAIKCIRGLLHNA